MARQKATMTFNQGMKVACKVITDTIREYSEQKYDDYEIRQYLSAKERLNNEYARDVINDLLKVLDDINEKIDEQLAKDILEIKEVEDVGTDGNGEVSAEAVHGSRAGSEEKVSEVHTGFSKA